MRTLKRLVTILATTLLLLTCANAAEPETVASAQEPARTLSDGTEINEANILAMLETVKAEWPEKTPEKPYYSGMKSPVRAISKTYPAYNWKTGEHVRRNMISTVYGCAGWVSRVSDRIFGQAAEYHETDLESARPGDFAILVNSAGEAMHFVLITDAPVIKETKITFAITESAPDRTGTYHVRWTECEHDTADTDMSYRVYTAWPDTANTTQERT